MGLVARAILKAILVGLVLGFLGLRVGAVTAAVGGCNVFGTW